jgi:Zn-dependent protease with chaperone function
MFAKPINLIAVYIITTINLAIVLIPTLILAVPFVNLEGNVLTIDGLLLQRIELLFFAIVFLVSFLMLVYMVLDFIFGFSVLNSLKGCKRYEGLKDYDFLTDIFKETQNKFAQWQVKLYVKESPEINAYAVGSARRKAMILTSGLINHYYNSTNDNKDFLIAIRSIMAHEMSHLINNDFLPTFLFIANQRVTNFISYLIRLIFNFVSGISAMIPIAGFVLNNILILLYNIINFFLNLFNRLIVTNIYNFLHKFISKSIEYRADRQAAKAFGGQNMAFALQFLGKDGYFNLFSDHPKTVNRIKKVQNIKAINFTISQTLIDGLSNYFALMSLVVICCYYAKQAKIDIITRIYLKDHQAINSKIVYFWQMIKPIFNYLLGKI